MPLPFSAPCAPRAPKGCGCGIICCGFNATTECINYLCRDTGKHAIHWPAWRSRCQHFDRSHHSGVARDASNAISPCKVTTRAAGAPHPGVVQLLHIHVQSLAGMQQSDLCASSNAIGRPSTHAHGTSMMSVFMLGERQISDCRQIRQGHCNRLQKTCKAVAWIQHPLLSSSPTSQCATISSGCILCKA